MSKSENPLDNSFSSKYKLQSYSCPICGGDRYKKLYLIQGFQIVRCECSMTFVNPRISNEQIFELYRHEYFHRPEDGYDDYERIADLRIQTFEKWYRDIIPYCINPEFDRRFALDIGCAAGYFLDILRKNHWKTVGIELDLSMHSSLIQKGYDVSDNPLEFFNSPHQFDLITMFDAIEHLPELQKNFTKISSLLSNQGILAISTPNIDSFQHYLFRSRWFQFKPIEHLYYFSPRTIAQLAKDNGFKIEEMRTSGQYANIPFIVDRLQHYGFHNLAKICSFLIKSFALERLTWYADTGSMFVILRKI